MKLTGVNPALAACAAIVGFWFVSIYGVPSKVEQHDRDLAAIFARLNAREEAERLAASEAERKAIWRERTESERRRDERLEKILSAIATCNEARAMLGGRP